MSALGLVATTTWDPAPKPAPGLCAGCYGWGFPIFPWRGKVSMKADARCRDCGGTGKIDMKP